ncbi:restriction endonuclease subunit S [Bacillaceae bacterium IKA-2]|nr:restriction endonuclease subunit S [Bacillaceae bacterium IKA-2]
MRKMKDSGISWLGEIPTDWEAVKIKHALKERKENNKPQKTDNILSLLKDRGVIPYREKGDIGNKSKENLEDYKLAYPGDIVLNSMNVIIGSVGLSKYFGAVSPVYYMLKNRYSKDSIEYFNYVFQTEEFQKSLIGYGNGILAHRMRIQMLKLNTVMIPYPLPELQKEISTYLDQKVDFIDNIIEKTKESIKEYKKYKQSLITETVTKGLNPNVKMKDSGIEWIGEVPEHWEARKLKYDFEIVKRIAGELGYNVLSITQQGLKVKDIVSNDGQQSSDYSKYQHVYSGDYAMNLWIC